MNSLHFYLARYANTQVLMSFYIEYFNKMEFLIRGKCQLHHQCESPCHESKAQRILTRRGHCDAFPMLFEDNG